LTTNRIDPLLLFVTSREVNLNLLAVFDAVLRTRSVTQTPNRLV